MNTHEIAIISGLAVAERLGAPYPFQDDKLALKQFETYLRYGEEEEEVDDDNDDDERERSLQVYVYYVCIYSYM